MTTNRILRALNSPNLYPTVLRIYNDAALLVWQNALRKLEAAHMAPPRFKLLEGLNNIISKLAPEFRQMLTHAEYNEKCNGKHWTYVELLARLHRHAAEAL